MKSLFKTAAGKNEILNLYDEKLKELNVEFEYINIDTGFGRTNIIATGAPSNPPIIVVHGSNGCAPIALETYPNLSAHFRVYAIDVLAQPNKSAEVRLSMKDDAYGQWMNELMTKLNIEHVAMIGFSFGGLIILKTLEYNESKIREVYLAAPAYIVNGNPIMSLLKVFIPMKRFMKTQKRRHIEHFLKALFTDRDEFAIKYLSKVFLNFSMDFTPVPVISQMKARAIRTPITIFAAKNDLLFPGAKMMKRASKIFPSLKKLILLEDSKHVQNRTHNALIEKTVIDHLLEHSHK